MIRSNSLSPAKRYSALLFFALVQLGSSCKKDKTNPFPDIATLKKPDKVDKVAGAYEGSVDYTYSKMTSYSYPSSPVYTSAMRTYNAQLTIEKINSDSFIIKSDNFYDSSVAWSYRLEYDTTSFTINKTFGTSYDITTVTLASGDSVIVTESRSQKISAGGIYDNIQRRVFRGRRK